MRTAGFVLLAALALPAAGCGSPSAPNSLFVAPAPAVTSLSPNLGSTGGATEVKIEGTGLGASVTFGGAAVTGRFDSRYLGGMWLYTPAHAAGTVDVVVSGQNGKSVTLTNAFTYASPQTFDFNGRWSGFGNNGQDIPIEFTIQDDLLRSASCDDMSGNPGAAVTFAPPRPVTNGEFSLAGDGVIFSGRIVSPSTATGTIRLGLCASDAWYASKQ